MTFKVSIHLALLRAERDGYSDGPADYSNSLRLNQGYNRFYILVSKVKKFIVKIDIRKYGYDSNTEQLPILKLYVLNFRILNKTCIIRREEANA